MKIHLPLDMQAELKKMIAISEEREKEEAIVSKQKPHAHLTLIPPQQPTHSMSVPYGYARSALFGIVQRGKRKYMKAVAIASWKNWGICYTGEQLNQADLDVLLTAAKMISSRNLHEGEVRTSFRALLKATGRKGTGQDNIKWLRSTLSRLTACDLTVRYNHKRYHGNILNWAEDEYTGEVVLWLNAHQEWLWQDAAWIATEQRQSLKTDLSKWMQSYVSTHTATEEKPHMIRVTKLYELSGSNYGRLRDFRRAINNAMEALHLSNVISGWQITDNDVIKFWKIK